MLPITHDVQSPGQHPLTVHPLQVPEESVYTRVLAARQSSETYPFDPVKFIPRYLAEYQLSWASVATTTPNTPSIWATLMPRNFTPTLSRSISANTSRASSKAPPRVCTPIAWCRRSTNAPSTARNLATPYTPAYSLGASPATRCTCRVKMSP